MNYEEKLIPWKYKPISRREQRYFDRLRKIQAMVANLREKNPAIYKKLYAGWFGEES